MESSFKNKNRGSELLTSWKSSELMQKASVLPHPGPLPLGEGESTPGVDKPVSLDCAAMGLESTLSQRERAGVRERTRHLPHASKIPSLGQDFCGYQQLRVWEDAIEYYASTCRVFRSFPFELKRVASQEIASVDSVHRNIAEGYARRSIREYLNFLNIALGSLAESVSGLHAYRKAGQITELDFAHLNALAYKLENGLLKLVESLERKQLSGDWIDHLIIKENNVAYGGE